MLRGSSRVCPCSSLPAQYPLLMQEWDWERNTTDPRTCSPGSNRKAWWRCRTCSAEWEARVADRTIGNGCPECALQERGRYSGRSLLCLEQPDPYASIVDAPGVDAAGLTCGNSTVRVVWSCAKCRPPGCMHVRTWTATVAARVRSDGCPYCLNRKVCPCTSLSRAYPEVAAEWGVRNGALRPDNVSPRSNMKVWWQCQSSTDSLVEWEATVDDRVDAWVKRGRLSRPRGMRMLVQRF